MKTARTFLLLELLIAFSLISLFAFPLIFSPFYRLHEEMKSLERIECERLCELLLAQVQKLLYQNAVPLKKISSKGKVSTLDELTGKKWGDFDIVFGAPPTKQKINFDVLLTWIREPVKDFSNKECALLRCTFATKTEKSREEFIYDIPVVFSAAQGAP